MSNNSLGDAQISQIIAKVREEAYAKGVSDTIARFAALAHDGSLPAEANSRASLGAAERLAAARGRPSKAVQLVLETIASNPGLAGVDVIAAVHRVDASVPAPTVRSALRRLRKTHKIWQRSAKWYVRKPHDDG